MNISSIEIERLLREDGEDQESIDMVISWLADEMDMDKNEVFYVCMTYITQLMKRMCRAHRYGDMY